MNTIPQISSFPDKTPVEAIQGNITAVYERKEMNGKFGPSTVQNAELSDSAGNKIKLGVWNHPDLNSIKGQEVILHSSKQGKGVSVKHNTYNGKTTVELNVNKDGVFQYVQVYKQNNPGAATSTPAVPQTPVAGKETAPVGTPGLTPINGAKVGMCLNNAVQIMVARGEDFSIKGLSELASEIMRLSNWMEAGNLVPKKKTEVEARDVKVIETATALVNTIMHDKPAPIQEGNDEDIPF